MKDTKGYDRGPQVGPSVTTAGKQGMAGTTAGRVCVYCGPSDHGPWMICQDCNGNEIHVPTVECTSRPVPRPINGGDMARFSYMAGWRDAGSAARRLAS